MVGRGTEPFPTALSVDSSITNCPHSLVGWDGTVPTDPVLPDPVGGFAGISGNPVEVPGDTAPPEDALPPPAASLCARGITVGCAHMAPCGHGVGSGTMPTGGQGAACVHPPMVLLPDP